MLNIKNFYDDITGSISYLIYCQESKSCALIDPIANFDVSTANITFSIADDIIAKIKKLKLELKCILETHIHADHLTACDYIKNKAINEDFGQNVKSAIGDNVKEACKYWAKYFEFTDPKLQTASYFDKLLKDGEKIKLGRYEIEVISTPGHTPCCVCYKIDDNTFVGDLLFMPDIGTARCDFPGGGAKQSYDSIQKILSLPDDIKLYTGHDYPRDRELQFLSTVIQQKEGNIMVADNICEQDFIDKRNAKDQQLDLPKLIYPSLQYNIFAGKYNNKFFKMPIS